MSEGNLLPGCLMEQGIVSLCLSLQQRHLGWHWSIFWAAVTAGIPVSYGKLKWLVLGSQRGWRLCLIAPFLLSLCLTHSSSQLTEVLLTVGLGAEVTWHQALKDMLKDAERHVMVFPNYPVLEINHLFSNHFWHQSHWQCSLHLQACKYR